MIAFHGFILRHNAFDGAYFQSNKLALDTSFANQPEALYKPSSLDVGKLMKDMKNLVITKNRALHQLNEGS